MGHRGRRSMQSDFARWCKIRSNMASAGSDFEVSWMTNVANHIEDHWTHGSHAAGWYRLQGRTPRYIAHILWGDSGPGAVTVETHPALELAEALSWSRFRLEHAGDSNVSVSINQTGIERPVYQAEGARAQVVERVSYWQGGDPRAA